MKINTGTWFQVVEYTLARQMLFLAGCGQRRMDGESLRTFENRGERGFYVSAEAEKKDNRELRTLSVDEGFWTNALHSSYADLKITVSRTSDPWCEYVDSGALMAVLVKKLAPLSEISSSSALGAGRRQQDYMDQYIAILRQWSKENPTHALQFI